MWSFQNPRRDGVNKLKSTLYEDACLLTNYTHKILKGRLLKNFPDNTYLIFELLTHLNLHYMRKLS